MRDLDKALADIATIRVQLSAGTAFRGYGPATMAATGVLALATTLLQALWPDDPTDHPLAFFSLWTATACVSGGLILIEMRARARRHHSGLADAMVHQAIERFVPAGVAGALLLALLWRLAPETLWMLPGLWQVLVSLGIFASARSLPRTVAWGGVWYFVAGFSTLLLSGESHTLSPWTMGLPFAIGQCLMATLLHVASGDDDGED